MYRKDHGNIPNYSSALTRRRSPAPLSAADYNPGGWGDRFGNGSWDDLWPGYMGSAALFHCPSDSADEEPEHNYNFGALKQNPDGTYYTELYCWSTGGLCYDWDDYSDYSWRDTSQKWVQEAARKFGLGAADGISYAYVGRENISPEEAAQSGSFRVAADNELEGDEKPCFHGSPQWCTGSYGSDTRRQCNMKAGYVPPGYRYVGGLEQADNHGQDGVNVLYLDWHAEFDGRSWPSPLGASDSEEWLRAQWGSPVSDECVAHWHNGRPINDGDHRGSINLLDENGNEWTQWPN